MEVYFKIRKSYSLVPTWWATKDENLSDEQIKQELDLCNRNQFGFDFDCEPTQLY